MRNAWNERNIAIVTFVALRIFRRCIVSLFYPKKKNKKSTKTNWRFEIAFLFFFIAAWCKQKNSCDLWRQVSLSSNKNGSGRENKRTDHKFEVFKYKRDHIDQHSGTCYFWVHVHNFNLNEPFYFILFYFYCCCCYA